MRYKVKTGMFAWLIFRISGLLLVLYLIIHINVIGNLSDPAQFDTTMTTLGSWQFRILEIGLLAVIIVHAMNGIRIFIVDFANGSLYQKKLFWTLFAVGAILFLAGTYPMLSHTLHAKDKQANIQIIYNDSGLNETNIVLIDEGDADEN
ncbi:succinate dehydrogenase, cytochrome b556 subunit [bacterium]|nr:succinate dehydrogenase, cytochrome b556 subunit [bacterium]